MKNPLSQKKKNTEEKNKDDHSTIAELEEKTAEIEAERERKRFAREERKFHRAQAEKRQKLERWVAPILLLATLLLSSLIFWMMK